LRGWLGLRLQALALACFCGGEALFEVEALLALFFYRSGNP
jgi:hypothetical protein